VSGKKDKKIETLNLSLYDLFSIPPRTPKQLSLFAGTAIQLSQNYWA
jgi:hypothetical protein